MSERHMLAGLAAYPRNIGLAGATFVAALLSACATTQGESVRERTDPNTATTVTLLTRPIELLSQTGRGAAADPFAYIAPFETDRQGERALFLWVSAPQNAGPLAPPQVMCNGQPLALQPLESAATASRPATAPVVAASPSASPSADPQSKSELSQLDLSQPPYEAPVPWSRQWYFRLPQDGLKCLAGGQGIALQTRAASGDAEVFTSDGKRIASLDAFTQRY